MEEVIEVNRRMLQKIRVHKSDRHGILMGDVGKEKIGKAIADAEAAEGDVSDKAAVLLISLVKRHPFEVGTGGQLMPQASTFSNRTAFRLPIPTTSM